MIMYVCAAVGITAIEDCLQDDVPQVIEDLANAGETIPIFVKWIGSERNRKRNCAVDAHGRQS